MLSPIIAPEVRDQLAALVMRDWRTMLDDRLIEHPSPNRWPGRKGERVRCVVWHITEGSYASALSWLTNPASDASANDLIDRDGTIAHLVAGADAPWANGPIDHPNPGLAIVRQAVVRDINPNCWTYAIECAGYSKWGQSGALADDQLVSLIARTAQACMEYRLTGDTQHILRHASFDSVNRGGCPGYSIAEMIAWTDAVRWMTQSWRGW